MLCQVWYSSFLDLERRIFYSISWWLSLSLFLASLNQLPASKSPQKRANFWSSIENTLAYLSWWILASYNNRYCIVRFHNGLSTPFVLDFSQLIFPFRLFKVTLFLYFSCQNFMSFHVILLNHLLAIRIDVDQSTLTRND